MYAEYLSQSRKVLFPSQFREIHKLAQNAVDELKSKEAEVISALQKADQYKVYRYIGLNSLFQYAQSLGLSESQAYSYITVARKAVECPGLQKAIENKEITISKAKTVASVINQKNQTMWLSLAKSTSKRELEREVARVNPQAIKKESSRFVNDHMLELQVTLEEDTFKLLERVKELMAQKTKRPVRLEEALKLLASSYIQKEDPVKKAQRVLEKRNCKKENCKNNIKDSKSARADNTTHRLSIKNNQTSKVLGTKISQDKILQNIKLLSPGRVPPRKPLPAHLKHHIYLRDQGRCQYDRITNHGQACNERKWLEIHHIKPLSHGGTDSVDNLITLCSAHHKFIHERTSDC